MATARVDHYFETNALTYIHSMDNKKFEKLFPGIKGKRYDSFSKFVGKDANGQLRPVDRIIFFKKNPSLHKCDGRCMHAKGQDCECSCGGKNHGAGG